MPSRGPGGPGHGRLRCLRTDVQGSVRVWERAAASAGWSPYVRGVDPDSYAYLFVAVFVPVRRIRGEGDRIARLKRVALAVEEDVLLSRQDDAELLAAVAERSGAGVVAWRTHDPLGLQGAIEVRGQEFIDCLSHGLLGDAFEVSPLGLADNR